MISWFALGIATAVLLRELAELIDDVLFWRRVRRWNNRPMPPMEWGRNAGGGFFR